jgi:hypothetical protein
LQESEVWTAFSCRDERQKDLLRPALEAIIDLGHPLVRPAGQIDACPFAKEVVRAPA